jgi:hypothetical protein
MSRTRHEVIGTMTQHTGQEEPSTKKRRKSSPQLPKNDMIGENPKNKYIGHDSHTANAKIRYMTSPLTLVKPKILQ